MKKNIIFIALAAIAIAAGGMFMLNQNNNSSNEVAQVQEDSSNAETTSDVNANSESKELSESDMRMKANDSLIKSWAENQYENEIKTSSKKQLDFSSFKDAMDAMSESRVSELDGLILEKTVSDIQSSMDSGLFTSKELVTYYLKRIEKYDVDNLNSVITLNPKALEKAEALDANRKSRDPKNALYGIPVLLKDNIATGDEMPNTAGAKALENALSKDEAIVVTKLRENGAIILGKANLSEWANYMTSPSNNGYSALGGQTHNPYGHFDVGGSSSGSASSASANLATLTLGTETSGSIMYPSSQNSVVGMKPTWGLWDNKQIIPIAESQDTAGPVVKHVEDAAALIFALTDHEKFSGRDFRQVLDKDFLKGKKIGIASGDVFSYFKRPGDDDTLARIKSELESLGAEVVEKEFAISDFVDIGNILKSEYKYGVDAYLEYNDVDGLSSIEDLIAFNSEDLKNRAPLGQTLIEDASKNALSKEDLEKTIESARAASRTTLDNRLDDVDCVIALSNHLSAIYAPAGYPAITVPAGYRESGEPIGLTFVGSAFEDDKLLSLAYSYEMGTQHRDIEKQAINDK